MNCHGVGDGSMGTPVTIGRDPVWWAYWWRAYWLSSDRKLGLVQPDAEPFGRAGSGAPP